MILQVDFALCLNHLQFADDTLIFCINNVDQVQKIGVALDIFLAISGLKVNYSKSQILGCKVSQEEFKNLADLLDVSVGTLPINYLGAALGDNPRRKSFWRPVFEKMRAKLWLWNSKWMSLSGRLVMLKSVMSVVLIYHMVVFQTPVGVIGEMEKPMRSFLWGEEMAAAPYRGLLGVKSVKAIN